MIGICHEIIETDRMGVFGIRGFERAFPWIEFLGLPGDPIQAQDPDRREIYSFGLYSVISGKAWTIHLGGSGAIGGR